MTPDSVWASVLSQQSFCCFFQDASNKHCDREKSRCVSPLMVQTFDKFWHLRLQTLHTYTHTLAYSLGANSEKTDASLRITTKTYDVIAISETWETDWPEQTLSINLNNHLYDHISAYTNRKGQRRGGVSLYNRKTSARTDNCPWIESLPVWRTLMKRSPKENFEK